MLIKAIETAYNGYKFRSRLEARWARFYDELGIRYSYEHEGYDLGPHGWYLPDFWLPDQQVWIEIKGPKPTWDEGVKANALAVGTRHPVYIFWGNIQTPSWDSKNDGAYLYLAPDFVKKDSLESVNGKHFDHYQWWCECPKCGKLDIAFQGRAHRICRCFHGDKGYNHDSERLKNAYNIARSERFGT